MTLLLAGDAVGTAQSLAGALTDAGENVVSVVGHDIARRTGGPLGQADDGVEHRLEAPVAEHHGAEHGLLGELARLGFDHQHGVTGARDHQVEIGFLLLLHSGIEHELALEDADAGGADRPHEGDARQREGSGGGDHRHDVGIVLEIVRQHGGDELRLVPVAVDEERTDRAIDEARHQRLALGRASLALEIAARNLAGGIGALLVVDGQREEIDTRLRRLLADDGGEHGALAKRCQHGTIGLAGNATSLETQHAAAPLGLFNKYIEHRRFLRSALGREAFASA